MNSLEQIKQDASLEAIPIIRDDALDFILNYIKTNNAKQILEIGSGIGYSSIMFAKCAADIFVSTIEIDQPRCDKARKNIIAENLADRIECFLGDALDFNFEKKFDLIFIDGPKAQYIKMFEKFKNNLSPRGAIISDNLSFHGMVDDLSLTHNYSTKKLVKKIRKYIQFLKANTEFETEFFSDGDGIAVCRRVCWSS